MRVPFAKVDCDGNELEYVKEVLDSGWLTTASKAKQFEDKFASLVDAKYAFAVNSCTAGLHLALEAIGVGQGDKVFVPTWTFTATAEVIRYLGADPIILDVDYETGLLTPEIFKQAISEYPDVKALLIVHFAGQPAFMDPNDPESIISVCRKNNIKIIEDAAHAFPAQEGNHKIGSIGDVTCFSFYANKTITTAEGGMLTTNDDDIADRVKIMRLHGIDRDIWDRFTSDKPSWEYDVIAPGFKYNMPDINAAIGLAQLERAFDMRAARQKCAELYIEALSEFSDLDLIKLRVPSEHHAWHLFPIILNEHAAISRNELIQNLADQGIGTSVHYKPLHRLKYYKERYSLSESEYPNAEKIWTGCLSLPIYPSLSDEDIQYVIGMLKKVLN